MSVRFRPRRRPRMTQDEPERIVSPVNTHPRLGQRANVWRFARRPAVPLHQGAGARHPIPQRGAQLGRRGESGARRHRGGTAMSETLHRMPTRLLLVRRASQRRAGTGTGRDGADQRCRRRHARRCGSRCDGDHHECRYGWRREVVTRHRGRFVFVDVLAGTYQRQRHNAGFKKAGRDNVLVASTDRVDLPPLVLEAGGPATQTLSVAPDAADLVQTTTRTRRLITRHQPGRHRLKGRDVLASQAPAGRGRHQSSRGAELESPRRGDHQRQDRLGIEFLLRWRQQQVAWLFGSLHALPASIQLRRSAYSQRTSRPIRPQFGGFDYDITRSGSRTSTEARRSTSATTRSMATSTTPEAAVPEDGSTDAVRAGALQIRQLYLDAGRARAHSRRLLQPQPQQAVLLLVAGPARAGHRSRQR